jgi:hypothetical protein
MDLEWLENTFERIKIDKAPGLPGLTFNGNPIAEF